MAMRPSLFVFNSVGRLGHDSDGNGGLDGRMTIEYHFTQPGDGVTLFTRTMTIEAYKYAPMHRRFLPDGQPGATSTPTMPPSPGNWQPDGLTGSSALRSAPPWISNSRWLVSQSGSSESKPWHVPREHVQFRRDAGPHQPQRVVDRLVAQRIELRAGDQSAATPVNSAVRPGTAPAAQARPPGSAATSCVDRRSVEARLSSGTPPWMASGGRRAPVDAAAGTPPAAPTRRRRTAPVARPVPRPRCFPRRPAAPVSTPSAAPLSATQFSTAIASSSAAGIRMLGRQPVVDRHHRAPAAPGELHALAVIGVQVAQDEST